MIRRFIIKLITWITLFIILVSVSCMDSENNLIFMVATAISLVWLILFGIANFTDERFWAD